MDRSRVSGGDQCLALYFCNPNSTSDMGVRISQDWRPRLMGKADECACDGRPRGIGGVGCLHPTCPSDTHHHPASLAPLHRRQNAQSGRSDDKRSLWSLNEISSATVPDLSIRRPNANAGHRIASKCSAGSRSTESEDGRLTPYMRCGVAGDAADACCGWRAGSYSSFCRRVCLSWSWSARYPSGFQSS